MEDGQIASPVVCSDAEGPPNLVMHVSDPKERLDEIREWYRLDPLLSVTTRQKRHG